MSWLLTGLVLAAMVPGLGVGGLAAWQVTRGGEAAAERRLRDTAAGMALAVERDIGGMEAAMRAFAASPAFGGDRSDLDLPSLDIHARRVAAQLDIAVGVAAEDGSLLLHTRYAPGTPLPRADLREDVARAFASGRAVVSGLRASPSSGAPTFVLGVPVLRPDGSVALVARASVNVERLHRLLAGSELPDDSFASLADAEGRILARSDARHGHLVGATVSEAGRRAMSGTPEGVYRSPTGDGVPRTYAFQQLRQVPGWTLVVAEPAAATAAGHRRALALLGLGGLLLLVPGALLAALLARRVLRPVQLLDGYAATLAAGTPGRAGDLPACTVAELEAVRRGFIRAEAAIAAREAALTASEARLRLATEGAGIGFWEADLSDGTLRLSAEATALLALPGLACTGAEWQAALHPEDREAVAEAWRRAGTQGGTYEAETRTAAPAADGGERWVLLRGRMDGEAGHGLKAAGLVMDITARRRAERGRAEDQARLRLALRASRMGIWEFDMRHGWWRLDARAVEITGANLPAGVWVDGASAEARAWFASIHPADQPGREAAHARLRHGTSDLYEAEYRVLRRGGRWARISQQGIVVQRDPASGAPLLLVGVASDVTDRERRDARPARDWSPQRAVTL